MLCRSISAIRILMSRTVKYNVSVLHSDNYFQRYKEQLFHIADEYGLNFLLLELFRQSAAYGDYLLDTLLQILSFFKETLEKVSDSNYEHSELSNLAQIVG